MKKREIKFRAWDSKYQTMMAEGFNLIGEVTAFGGIEIMLMENSKKHNDTTPSLERLNDVEIMQFTGLKDKNGKQIYEGDIVRHFNENMVIVNVYGCFYHKHRTDEAYGKMHTIHYPYKPLENNEYYEVIGNIYQNKDLLT